MNARAEPRWLDPERAADYLSVRVEQLRQLVRAGLVPEPNYLLGKRRPRWDRLQLDASIQRAARPSIDQAIEEAFKDGWSSRRKTQAKRRELQGIQLRTQT